MTYKATHLEIVSDLTAEKFLEALQHFVSRQGCPLSLNSDNATNFTGLNNFFQTIEDDLVSQAAKDGFHWKFIPPSSPNFGGVWEAAVKSAKKHLLSVTHGQALTFEEYSTLFTRIEAILNSLPLCAGTEQGTEPLTPGHFLIGRPLNGLPYDVDTQTLAVYPEDLN